MKVVKYYGTKIANIWFLPTIMWEKGYHHRFLHFIWIKWAIVITFETDKM